MSLHHLAEQVRAAGRKNDKVLVHMTPNEVQGLQALALAHGGSLTINPHTGLPEADFLDAILPMAAGFLLAPLTAGTSLAFLGATPLASALTVGAGYTLATGSLEKGLMAGLGAYGGAGLGAAASTGATAAAPGQIAANGQAAVGANTVASAPTQSLFGGQAMQGGTGSLVNTTGLGYAPYGTTLSQSAMTPFVPAPSTASIIGNSDIAKAALTNPVSPVTQGNLLSSVNPNQATMAGINNSVNLSRQAASIVPASAVTPTVAPASTSMFSNYSMPTDWGQFYDKLPTGTLPALAASGMYGLNQKKNSGLGALPVGDSYERPYEYSVDQDPLAYVDDGSTRERVYFTEPRFKALPIRKVADGGLMDDSAGKIERMSEGNVVTMQEQEDGVPKYAFGGSAAALSTAKDDPSPEVTYEYDPVTMQYTQTTTTMPAAPKPSVSLMGLNPVFNGFSGGINQAGGIPGKGGIFAGLGKQIQQAAPQPTVTTKTLGGVSTPFVPQGTVANTPMFTNSNIAPNINIPEYQTPEQQLGLQSFYQNMEKQLAAKGAQIMSQNMAGGGMAAGGSPSFKRDKQFVMGQGWVNPSTQPVSNPYANGLGGPLGSRFNKAQQTPAAPVEPPAPTYTYNPKTQQFTDDIGQVTGGISNSSMQAQPQPANPVTPNINIPQPQNVDQRLGLGNFYSNMNQQINPFTPSINIPQSQNVNQRLGFGNFYSNMNRRMGMPRFQGFADGGMANDGYNLGGYSDGGRLLRGPGDGVSDSIPAVIGDRQPARLADGEFVVPARIVSELGNGSTEAGAKKLYAMMHRVQNARRKTVGKDKVAVNTKAEKLLPA